MRHCAVTRLPILEPASMASIEKNLPGQVGTVTSHPRQVLTDVFPIVAALQVHLERKRAYRKDV